MTSKTRLLITSIWILGIVIMHLPMLKWKRIYEIIIKKTEIELTFYIKKSDRLFYIIDLFIWRNGFFCIKNRFLISRITEWIVKRQLSARFYYLFDISFYSWCKKTSIWVFYIKYQLDFFNHEFHFLYNIFFWILDKKFKNKIIFFKSRIRFFDINESIFLYQKLDCFISRNKFLSKIYYLT